MSGPDRDVAPPLRSDEDLEPVILGTMLAEPIVAREACDRLSGDEFKHPGHRAIFRAIRAELADGGTPHEFAVAQRLEADARDQGDVLALAPNGVPPYLVHLTGYRVAASNIPKRCERLAELHALDQAAKAADAIAQDAREPGADPARVLETARVHFEVIEASTGGGADELVRLALAGDEFMAADFYKPRPLLGTAAASLLREGGGAILHAPAGLGKTYLGEQIAYAVASGEPWLDRFGTPEGGVPVVLLQAELSDAALQERRRGNRRTPKWPHQLWTLTLARLGHQLDILDPADRNKLVRIVREKGARLLVLDPLSQFHSEAESPEGFARVRRAIQDIILRTGCAVLLIHHEGKPTEVGTGKTRASAYRARGATVLTTDWAELGMGLEADPAGHHRLTFDKVRHTAKPSPIYLKQDDAGWWEPTEPPVLVGDKTLGILDRALTLAGVEVGLSKSELVEISRRNGGAKSDKAVNDALDRLARSWGLTDRQALNIGSEARPRYVWKGGSQEQSGSQTDFQLGNDCAATDSELDKF